MNTQPILPLLLSLTLSGGALLPARAVAAAPDTPPASESARGLDRFDTDGTVGRCP